MKSSCYIFILFFFISFCFKTTYSQNWEKGLGVGYLKTSGTTIVAGSSGFEIVEPVGDMYLLSAHLKAYIPVYSFNQNLTIGTNFGLAFEKNLKSTSINYAPNDGLALQLPAYLTLRFGNGSNKKSESNFGFGIGIGYKYSLLLLDKENDDNNDDGFYTYFKPTACADVLYGRIILRFEAQLSSFTQHTSFKNSPNYGYKFSYYSVSLLISSKSLRIRI